MALNAPYEKVSPDPTGDFFVACEGDQRSSQLSSSDEWREVQLEAKGERQRGGLMTDESVNCSRSGAWSWVGTKSGGSTDDWA